jgi:hypothetical protein
MALTLKETRAVSGLADVLYDFLPGAGSASWTGHVNFGTAAGNAFAGLSRKSFASRTKRVSPLMVTGLDSTVMSSGRRSALYRHLRDPHAATKSPRRVIHTKSMLSSKTALQHLPLTQTSLALRSFHELFRSAISDSASLNPNPVMYSRHRRLG